MSEDRIRVATNTATASSATVIRPLPIAIDAVEEPGHRLPVSGAPTEPPRKPAELT